MILAVPTLLAGCSQSPRTNTGNETGGGHPLAATYTAQLPAASGPGRNIVLELRPDMTAMMTADYQNGQPPVVDTGTWKALSPKEAEVTLRRQNTTQAPESMAFRLDGSQLTATRYDDKLWGSAGLSLTRRGAAPGGTGAGAGAAGGGSHDLDLAGTSWQWVNLVTPVESITVPEPGRYTLEFGAEGRVAILADCNRAGGPFKIKEREISLNLLFMTRAACAEGSLSDRYIADLTRVSSWFTREGDLYLEMPVDSGTLRFRRVR